MRGEVYPALLLLTVLLAGIAWEAWSDWKAERKRRQRDLMAEARRHG